MRTFVSLFWVLVSVVVLTLAATRYPGGYDWIDQSVSSLFQPTALDGSENGARPLAVVGVVSFCLSIAIAFASIAKSCSTKLHQKTIQIAGIGSMVYTALLVTPMHDVLIGVALLFFVTATVAIFHRLYLERRFALLGIGAVCLALTLANAAMYYGDLLDGFLPVVQKLSLVAWVGWLLWLAHSGSRPASIRRA